ncbi:DUF1990 family protein [Streptomyces albidus (ex Kaewkla and Franco 2022)]|uniref:DUF1990 family protein n=1 Tax=Streptomyces albidus (ex Kaewkla and Franco 2022) TaxID=722709 RepID=UPI0015EEBC15|nr:DUF1990 domain-containing protein [Streptomyces albidus (ex Kaewkla and Franco 2022)]
MTEGTSLNYPGVGATREGAAAWPSGFRKLEVRTRVGHGDADFAVAAGAVSRWGMHRAAGVRFDTDAREAAPGVDVMVGLGVGPLRLHAPCRVVWTAQEKLRAGWAYGTLPGHPVRGEEAFVVIQDDDGTVWLEVRAFSMPVTWPTRAAGPLLPVFQRWYARRCGRVLRRLVDRGGTGGGETGDGRP